MNKRSKFKVENTNNSIKLEDCIWNKNKDNNKSRVRWGIDKDKLTQFLNENANNYTSPTELCEKENTCTAKCLTRRLGSDYLHAFNWNYRKKSPFQNKIYHDKEWLLEEYMVEGKNAIQIAEDIGVTTRVIKKWLVEKHRITQKYRMKNQKLNDIQKQLVIAGLLGDGHIDKRENQPIYIESHAENQKDYLYWKYDIMSNLCNKEPVKINVDDMARNGKIYHCQEQYRFGTRILFSLKPHRRMNNLQLLNSINAFIFSVWLLDDASRSHSNWSLCVARFTDKEKNMAISIFKNRFNLDAYLQKDDRYIIFRAESSRRIDDIILDNIPNDLDIIKYKITENHNICGAANYRILDNDKGLSRFAKRNNIVYNDDLKKYFDAGNTDPDDIIEKFGRDNV